MFHKFALALLLAWALAMGTFTVTVVRAAVNNYHVLNRG